MKVAEYNEKTVKKEAFITHKTAQYSRNER